MFCMTGVYFGDKTNMIFVILHLNVSCLSICSSCNTMELTDFSFFFLSFLQHLFYTTRLREPKRGLEVDNDRRVQFSVIANVVIVPEGCHLIRLCDVCEKTYSHTHNMSLLQRDFSAWSMVKGQVEVIMPWGRMALTCTVDLFVTGSLLHLCLCSFQVHLTAMPASRLWNVCLPLQI